MIAGHFGFAAAVKAKERQAPLWALMLASQWLDVVFVPLVGAGIEGLTPVPGSRGGYGEVIIHADYTHSIVGALALSALFGLASAARWGRRTGVVLGGVVVSHWGLDLLVHRADMPVLPGNLGGLSRMGLGLWRWPAAAAGIELLIVLAGTYLYTRAAVETVRSAGGDRRRALVVGGVALAVGLLTLGLNVLGF
jgi:hypothetical protein